VLVDDEPVCACMMPAGRAAGAEVETLAGLVKTDPLAGRLKDAFLQHGAAQCGICTPGVMVAAVALLRRTPSPDEQQVKDALGGVLCRCTGYRKIIDAVLSLDTPTAAARVNGDGTAVGAAIPRLDGLPKVSGSERFGDDVAPADALAVRVLRSPYHHASFVFGDLAAYVEANPGVATVLSAADIPGVNRFGVIPRFADQPAFAETVARFRGEAVAAVVGEPAVIEALDLDAFPVTWTELLAALTPEQSSAEGAAILHAHRENNLMCQGFVQCGDTEAGLAAAEVVVEGEFETGFVEHAYIEPEAGFARRVGDRIEIHACTQAPFLDRDSMADLMGLPPTSVRIVPTAAGGGFGSKLDISLQPYVALAAWKVSRPVRILYSRKESMQSTTKRHPSQISTASSTPAPMPLGGRRYRTACRCTPRGPIGTRTTAPAATPYTPTARPPAPFAASACRRRRSPRRRCSTNWPMRSVSTAWSFAGATCSRTACRR
jgi:hypothetical protein